MFSENRHSLKVYIDIDVMGSVRFSKFTIKQLGIV